MDTASIIELKASILEDNDADADLLRDSLRKQKTCLINVMSSPGSGKTSTIIALKPFLEKELRFGVMEADIDSDVDARTMLAAGIPSVQLHTGGMCHLDADMTRQGINAINRDDLDLVFLENVGNLVCPAEYDTGAALNLTILSVPEGDDKPAKYPLMYKESSVLVINKVDALPVFDFDMQRVKRDILTLNPEMKIFCISAKTGEGIKELASYLTAFVKEWNE